jgi:hypothetical protein
LSGRPLLEDLEPEVPEAPRALSNVVLAPHSDIHFSGKPPPAAVA